MLLLASCTVGPDFTPPTSTEATAFHQADVSDRAVNPGADPDPRWWNAFDDPMLSRLIDEAVSGNLDLKQAVLRVVEARTSVTSARAAGLPTLRGTGSYMREQLGAKGLLESKGVYGELNALADQNSPINGITPGLGNELAKSGTGLLNGLTQPVDLYQYGLDASWELDLFGRVRRSVEQAEASAEAQQEATNDSLLMLESEVAQVYAQYRGAQMLTQTQNENIASDHAVLELTQRLAKVGLDTALSVDQAQTQLDQDLRQLPGYEKQAQQALDQLNVLVGKPPGEIDAMLAPIAPLPKLPPIIGTGVPSTLARRRPDIREAEAQLHAATANVGVAVASFYPDVSLTGNLGLRATDASYLTNWASHFYSFGPSVSLPIFQGGSLSAGLRMARAQEAAAALNYRGTVLNALREVADGLVAYRTDRAARDRLADTVKSAEDTLYLAKNRYANGLESFIDVLDAQKTLVSARQQLVEADLSLIDDVVALYRALGGGWEAEQDSVKPRVAAAAPPPAPAALDAVVP
jgi:NodT family efflux transporter outer membrane factor (OMF) lipoprotein